MEILVKNGWTKGRSCNSCKGNAWEKWIHANKPQQMVEIHPRRKLFRFTRDGVRRSGGTLDSLQFQYFIK